MKSVAPIEGEEIGSLSLAFGHNELLGGLGTRVGQHLFDPTTQKKHAEHNSQRQNQHRHQ
jgi:hypothetical protein